MNLRKYPWMGFLPATGGLRYAFLRGRNFLDGTKSGLSSGRSTPSLLTSDLGSWQWNVREWIVDNIFYRVGGCYYHAFTQYRPLFDFIQSKIPDDFLGREISDLGCGDGQNTLRIKKAFEPKRIIGYDKNDSLIKRARHRGLEAERVDLNRRIPCGEMAVSTFALHHLHDKGMALREMARNFNYVFLCEPVRDLYHILFDAGRTLSRKEWVRSFDEAFRHYELHQFRSSLIVFFRKQAAHREAPGEIHPPGPIMLLDCHQGRTAGTTSP